MTFILGSFVSTPLLKSLPLDLEASLREGLIKRGGNMEFFIKGRGGGSGQHFHYSTPTDNNDEWGPKNQPSFLGPDSLCAPHVVAFMNIAGHCWSRRLACATLGGGCKRSWPMFSLTLLVQAACLLHLWLRTEVKLAIVFGSFACATRGGVCNT